MTALIISAALPLAAISAQVLPETLQPQITQLVHPVLTKIVEPPLVTQTREYSCDHAITKVLHQNYQVAKRHLLNRFSTLEAELAPLERFDLTQLALMFNARASYLHTIDIMFELASGNYDEEAARTYLGWSIRLFVNHLSGGATDVARRVDEMAKILTQPDLVKYVERSDDEKGHSMSWTMIANGTPMALLKESAIVKQPDEIEVKRLDGSVETLPLKIALHHPLCFSSFQKSIPDMPLTAKVNDYELVCFELDALLGFDLVPITYKAHFVNSQKQAVVGTVQQFVQDGKPAGTTYIYGKDCAKSLMTLHAAKVHKAAISGILKGLMAHHMENYLMRETDGKIVEVVEIDLEEAMPPFNQIPSEITPSWAETLVKQRAELSTQTQTLDVVKQIAEIDRRIQTMRKSIILCRMWLMGLPQTKKPLDRALLLILNHPSIRAMLDAYHTYIANNDQLHPSALAAQQERLNLLQAMSQEELKKPVIELTARDLYFAIFGGREIYELAKANGYPDLVTFNNVVSDPYQHVLKDFTHPEKMAPSGILHPITDKDSEERKIVKINLQFLEQSV